MPTPPLDHFADLYASGRLLFFAGSGISRESGLPSAEQVLRHTLSAALTNTAVNDVEELLKLQPEVFYETLLTFSSNNEKILSLWTALHPHVLARFGQYPKGNIVHKALVKYSAQFGIPILTTNFDTLFESAPEQEGMKSPLVYLPTQPTPDAFPSNTAMICKLHGTIEANGNPDVSSLYTTMTQIAKVNVRWIKYLTTLMKEFHICFVGYSGRDLDIFPLIEVASHESETKTPIWINEQFSGDPSDGPSKRCKALRLEGLFPSELLARILPHDAQSPPSLVDSDPALSSLASELRTSLDLSAESQQLLHAQLLQKLGQYTQALTLVTSIGITPVHQHYGTYLLLSSRLRHEISEYERSKALAKSAFTWACRRRLPGYRNLIIQSLCSAADPHRMIVPFDTYFEDQFVSRAVLTVKALVVFTVFLVMLKVVAWSAKNGTLSIETCHEMMEHRVRLLSIPTGILMTLGKILPIEWLKKWARRRWNLLHTKCLSAGYAAGMANCQKFIKRLHGTLSLAPDDSIYRLLTSNTGIELTLRNEANAKLESGNYKGARRLFMQMSDGSRRSGNRLNEIKAICGIAWTNLKANTRPLLHVDELRRFNELVDALDSVPLKRYMQRLRDNHLV